MWRGGMSTKRADVHEARKSNDPEVRGVDDVTTVDLGAEQVLDTRVSGRGIEQRTNQKTIR